MGDKAHLGNTAYQLKALKRLVSSLPKRSAPVVTRERRPQATAKRLKGQEVKDLAEAYQAGATIAQLAKRFGINPTTVSNILKRENVATRGRKLSDADIDTAERLYAEGLSLERVANRLNVTAGAIRFRLVKRGVKMRDTHGRP